MAKKKDLLGMRFGRYTVLKEAEPILGSRGEKLTRWLCRCDCGTEKIVRASELIRGHTVSCGCLGKENRRRSVVKHGLSNNRVYHIYLGMIDRCFDPNSDKYDGYGGRGITVCDEWLGDNGASAFAEWAMSHGYDDTLTIDRIDVNGNYEPSNCRWADNYQQQNNKRTNVFITVNGVTKTMKEWSRENKINYTTIKQRIYKGWNPILAVTTPPDKRFTKKSDRSVKYDVDGQLSLFG